MKIEEAKIGDEVWVKGVVSDVSYNIHGEKMFDVRTTSLETPNGFIHKDYVKTELDQPKLVVPQFVADWYEEHKDSLYNEIYKLHHRIMTLEKPYDKMYQWYGNNNDSMETLINMHQFDYTVEE